MAEAMTVLFRDRADRGLEFEAIFDLLPPPEVFQCGEETLETAESLIDQRYEGLFKGLDLTNQRDFLQFVALYFNPPIAQ